MWQTPRMRRVVWMGVAGALAIVIAVSCGGDPGASVAPATSTTPPLDAAAPPPPAPRGDAETDAGPKPPPFHCTRKNESPRFRVEQVVGPEPNLFAPWAMVFLPNGDMLFTERGTCTEPTCSKAPYTPGRVRRIAGGKLLPDPVPGAPASVAGAQGGMLDLRLHPDFATNAWIYISYVAMIDGAAQPDVTTSRAVRVSRFTWNNGRLEDPRPIFAGELSHPIDDHFGGRMVFGADGKLYVTLGDRHLYFHPQDRKFLHGKVIRLEDDGAIPKDNPFVGQPDARPEVFTYGHRNGQGLAVQPVTGNLFQTEHGNEGGDEINLLRAGHNYGYPLHEHYETEPGMDPPVKEYTPSIAPSGAVFYNSNLFRGWCDSLFVAGLGSHSITRILFDGAKFVEDERILRHDMRIRSVTQSPEGYLYFCEDEIVTARIFRIVPDP